MSYYTRVFVLAKHNLYEMWQHVDWPGLPSFPIRATPRCAPFGITCRACTLPAGTLSGFTSLSRMPDALVGVSPHASGPPPAANARFAAAAWPSPSAARCRL